MASILDITPEQAIKMAETKVDMTPKERQKVLALGLYFLALTKNIRGIEIAINWQFSQFVAGVNGFEIPDFCPQFMIQIVDNPPAFKNYK